MMTKKVNIGKFTPVIALVLMLIIFSLFTEGKMLSPMNITMLIDQTVVLLIACSGTLFVAALGSVDLSVGVVLALSAVVGDVAYQTTGSTFLMVVVAIAIGAGFGVLTGFLTAKCKMASFMCTLAMAIGVRGVVNYIQSVVGISFASPEITMLQRNEFKIPLLVLIVAVCWFIFEYTKIGKRCQAIGENEVVAGYSGVPVIKTKIFAFIISGITAAIAGIFTVARLGGTSTTMGSNFEIKVLIGIFVGGVLVRGGSTARSYKVIIGAFVVMVIENGLKMMGYASSEINEAAMGILLMVILFLTITAENRKGKAKKELKKQH